MQEGATALVCTLLPAIEPLTYVTIRPRDRRPLGQTVVRTNAQRERTMLYTQRYLKEQLLTVLAGETSPRVHTCWAAAACHLGCKARLWQTCLGGSGNFTAGMGNVCLRLLQDS